MKRTYPLFDLRVKVLWALSRSKTILVVEEVLELLSLVLPLVVRVVPVPWKNLILDCREPEVAAERAGGQH